MVAAAVTIVALSISQARAAFFVRVDPVQISAAAIADNPSLSGARCVDLIAVATAGEGFYGGGVSIDAPPGVQFFHHPVSTNFRPNPALVAVFPSLEFDTFSDVRSGQLYDPGSTLDPGTPQWNNTELNRFWFGRPQIPGTFETRFARITWTGDAVVAGVAGYWPTTTLLTRFDIVLPEPASLAMLPIAALTFLCRRRRRRRSDGGA
jgi:hypothetical protein